LVGYYFRGHNPITTYPMEKNPWSLFSALLALRGEEGTCEYLKKGLTPEIKFDDPIVENIIRTVCGKFCISVDELIYGTGRKNDRKMAIGFCTYYLHESQKLVIVEIASLLKKEESICRKAMRNMSNLNPKHVTDQHYLHYKKELDTIFLNDKN
jgi:hypothetical protein